MPLVRDPVLCKGGCGRTGHDEKAKKESCAYRSGIGGRTTGPSSDGTLASGSGAGCDTMGCDNHGLWQRRRRQRRRYGVGRRREVITAGGGK